VEVFITDFLEECPTIIVTNYGTYITYINIQQNFIMFIIALGQRVSILIESSSGPSKKIDPSLEMFTMCCLNISK